MMLSSRRCARETPRSFACCDAVASPTRPTRRQAWPRSPGHVPAVRDHIPPRGSYLINAGRGGLVDEGALRDAIVSGHLAGAGLDVLEHETEGTNPFADVPEVIVTPHLGGGSRNSMNGVVDRCTANIRRFLAGQEVSDRIDLGDGSPVSRQGGS